MMRIERRGGGEEERRGEGKGEKQVSSTWGAARTKRRNKFCAGEAIKVNASTKFQISQSVATKKKNNIQGSSTKGYAVKQRI